MLQDGMDTGSEWTGETGLIRTCLIIVTLFRAAICYDTPQGIW